MKKDRILIKKELESQKNSEKYENIGITSLEKMLKSLKCENAKFKYFKQNYIFLSHLIPGFTRQSFFLKFLKIVKYFKVF